MLDRRHFLKITGLTGLTIPFIQCKTESETNVTTNNFPVVVSTWNFGKVANQAAWKILENKGSALDAVEAGVRVIESDTSNVTVGKGGLPDREGNITLDACIMDSQGNAGSVAYLQNIEHPISVARKVMEETPHVMMVGKGAYQFAISQGFRHEDLNTEETRRQYKEWLERSEYNPIINIENHDTIGMLAIDHEGNISGACTTSGLAYKMAGRVGDSPIIGAGLYLDPEVGGCVATGLGEEIIRVSGSAMVVELMRGGACPSEACQELVDRVIKRNSDISGKQVCFLAIDKNGNTGSHSLYNGFQYAVKSETREDVVDSSYNIKQ